MSDKLNIEQLVSSKLGEAEITPSQGAWASIHRKLRWKQFLRFNPGQFNAYYLAGVIIAATGLIVILSTKSASPVPADPVEIGPATPKEIRPPQNLTDPVESRREKREKKEKQEKSITSKADPEPQVEVTDTETSPSVSDTISLNREPVEEVEVTTENPVAIPVETVISSPAIENQISTTPVAYFTSSAQTGCAPLEVQFHNQSVHSVTYIWTFGMDVQSTASDPLYLFEEPGTYEVTLRTEDKDGQSSIHKQTIEVYPVPTADFEVENGFEGIDGHVSLNLLNYSTNANAYRWHLLTEDRTVCNHWESDDFQPPLKLTDIKNGADQMRLIATNEFGCVDTAVKPLSIRMESNDVKIKFATAFSPNPTGPGDGTFSPHEKRIDLFHPIFFEVPAEYDLKVYTKRGELVFETKDVYRGWDGYYQEERSAGGVYVWMLEGTWLNGESFTMQGDVTLIWQDLW